MTPVARRSSVIVGLVALFCGGSAAGTFTYIHEHHADAASETHHDARAHEKPFSDATDGQCLDWKTGADGTVSDFQTVDCAKSHRFEVSHREDLSSSPTSKYGPKDPMPNRERQSELSDELCKAPTLTYLGGKFDPVGRFTIAPILPPQKSWDNGDRTLLCGLQVPDGDGHAGAVTGKAADQDQSLVFKPGECVAVTENNEAQKKKPAYKENSVDATAQVVDCNADHQYEVTDIINLGEKFTDFPSPEAQNEYLNQRCTESVTGFVGDDDKLYNSTLEPFWTTLTEASWKGGSRHVNCALVKTGDHDTLSVLKGSAKGPFTINGNPPPPQPPRAPKREK
ncbi:septum formation family protein [Corynebacterium kroppenstedtii]|uniref:septum formation family protein n=1 Tax=Corynebacterium sp. PCR 32 TaxID=3351342 RepID=UPI0030A602AF